MTFCSRLRHEKGERSHHSVPGVRREGEVWWMWLQSTWRYSSMKHIVVTREVGFDRYVLTDAGCKDGLDCRTCECKSAVEKLVRMRATFYLRRAIVVSP